MDPLAEMHLALREAGWEPEYEDESDEWSWVHPDDHLEEGVVFFILRYEGKACGDEFEYRGAESIRHDLESLRCRLKELAR